MRIHEAHGEVSHAIPRVNSIEFISKLASATKESVAGWRSSSDCGRPPCPPVIFEICWKVTHNIVNHLTRSYSQRLTSPYHVLANVGRKASIMSVAAFDRYPCLQCREQRSTPQGLKASSSSTPRPMFSALRHRGRFSS